MRTREILSLLLLLIPFAACEKGEKSESDRRPKGAGDGHAVIPLDTLRQKESGSVLRFDAQGQTLTNFLGVAVSPAAFPAAEGEIMRGSSNAPQFEGFFIAHESLPNKAEEEPARRIYNLPELLDRLAAEGKLPEDILSVWPLNDSMLQVVIKKPTVLAASFSQGRTVKILNRSKLILICPYCDNIQLSQTEIDGKPASINVHSNVCISYDYKSKGSFARHLFGPYFLGSIEARVNCDKLDPDNIRETAVVPKPSELRIEAWMPQALITQKLRSESIAQTALRWTKIYPLDGVR